jgi:hypothetical protein
MAQEWAEKLQNDKVKEFSFFPTAYTPFKKGGFELPEMELEWDGSDDGNNADTAPQSSMPQWAKNLSFTIGGVTIGAAAVFGFFGGGAPSAAPAAACPQTTCTPATLPTTSTPKSTGGPRTTGAATSSPAAATSSAATATSSASAGTP